MKKIGYWLGAVSSVWLMVIGGVDFPPPFWKHAIIVVGGVAVGIAGLVFSVWLVYTAKRREKEEYRLLIGGRKSSLLRQCRRIAVLKR